MAKCPNCGEEERDSYTEIDQYIHPETSQSSTSYRQVEAVSITSCAKCGKTICTKCGYEKVTFGIFTRYYCSSCQ